MAEAAMFVTLIALISYCAYLDRREHPKPKPAKERKFRSF
jgi:hypothetical protein